MSSPFNILQQSPLDQLPPSEPAEAEPEAGSWVASRFNIQTTLEDGSLVVWNTLRGSMTTFPAAQREVIRGLLTHRPFEAQADGIVKYLRDRGYLVREGRDEYQALELRAGQQHYRSDNLELTLLASEDCNFRCEYCYERFPRGTMQPWVRSAIKQLIENRAESLRRLHVSWFGGEPLYGFEAMEDLGEYFLKAAEEYSFHFAGSITTNGYLLTPPVVDKLLRWQVKYIQVTIDGSPEDHNRLRHTRDGKDTFSTILDNIKACRDRPDDFSMQIRINYDPRSRSRLDDFFALLGEEFGNDPRFRLLLRPVGRWGGTRDQDIEICSPEERKRVSSELAEKACTMGFANFDDLRKSGRFGASVCYAARPYHFIIGADGKVMKCTVALDTEESNIVGQITPDGELGLDEEQMSRWCLPPFTKQDKCQKCVIVPLCQGMACPRQTIRRGKSHCPSLRTSVKESLALVHKSTTISNATTEQRKVWIEPGAAVGA